MCLLLDAPAVAPTPEPGYDAQNLPLFPATIDSRSILMLPVLIYYCLTRYWIAGVFGPLHNTCGQSIAVGLAPSVNGWQLQHRYHAHQREQHSQKTGNVEAEGW